MQRVFLVIVLSLSLSLSLGYFPAESVSSKAINSVFYFHQKTLPDTRYITAHSTALLPPILECTSPQHHRRGRQTPHTLGTGRGDLWASFLQPLPEIPRRVFFFYVKRTRAKRQTTDKLNRGKRFGGWDRDGAERLGSRGAVPSANNRHRFAPYDIANHGIRSLYGKHVGRSTAYRYPPPPTHTHTHTHTLVKQKLRSHNS